MLFRVGFYVRQQAGSQGGHFVIDAIQDWIWRPTIFNPHTAVYRVNHGGPPQPPFQTAGVSERMQIWWVMRSEHRPSHSISSVKGGSLR